MLLLKLQVDITMATITVSDCSIRVTVPIGVTALLEYFDLHSISEMLGGRKGGRGYVPPVPPWIGP